MKRNDLTLDWALRDATAIVSRICTSAGLDVVARAARRSKSVVSRWRTEGGGPLETITRLVWHLSHDGHTSADAITEHLASTSTAAHLVIDGDGEAQIHEAMLELIHGYHGVKSEITRCTFSPASTDALHEQALRTAAAARRMAALLVSCKRKGVDPFAARRVRHGRTVVSGGRRYSR